MIVPDTACGADGGLEGDEAFWDGCALDVARQILEFTEFLFLGIILCDDHDCLMHLPCRRLTGHEIMELVFWDGLHDHPACLCDLVFRDRTDGDVELCVFLVDFLVFWMLLQEGLLFLGKSLPEYMEFLDILLEFGAVSFGRGIVGVITEFLAIEFLQDIEMAKERVVIVEVILIRPCHMGFHRFGDGFLVVEARIAKRSLPSSVSPKAKENSVLS